MTAPIRLPDCIGVSAAFSAPGEAVVPVRLVAHAHTTRGACVVLYEARVGAHQLPRYRLRVVSAAGVCAGETSIPTERADASWPDLDWWGGSVASDAFERALAAGGGRVEAPGEDPVDAEDDEPEREEPSTAPSAGKVVDLAAWRGRHGRG